MVVSRFDIQEFQELKYPQLQESWAHQTGASCVSHGSYLRHVGCLKIVPQGMSAGCYARQNHWMPSEKKGEQTPTRVFAQLLRTHLLGWATSKQLSNEILTRISQRMGRRNVSDILHLDHLTA